MLDVKKQRRPRYEITCSKEELEMLNELSKLMKKKRNRILIELAKDKLEELKENNK